MKKITVFVCFYILTLGLSFGQESKIKTNEPKRQLYVEDQAKISSVTRPAIESAYFGYDQKIAMISLNNAIPTGFPTKEEFASKETYRIAINKWIKENPSLIKPEHKETVITDK